MDLCPTAGNPEPKGAQVMPLVTADGVTLRAVRWRQTARRCRGTVCLATGRGEFVEKYFETIADLRRRGFAVVAFDWRGQGGSQRALRNPRKGDVRNFRDYARDLEAVVAQVLVPHMPRPWFGLAHSMGGAIYLAAAHDGRLPFARAVLVAPMIDIVATQGKRWPRALGFALRWIGLGRDFVPGGGETSVMTKPFAGNALTSDPVRYARNAEAAAAAPHLAIGDPTVRWVDAALRFITRFRAPRYALDIRTPLLVLAAGADTIVSTPAIERFCARLKGGHAIVLPGARHEILMEREPIREAFWAAFDAFVPGQAETIPPADGKEAGHRSDMAADETREAGSAIEDGESGSVDARVTRRHDRAPA